MSILALNRAAASAAAFSSAASRLVTAASFIFAIATCSEARSARSAEAANRSSASLLRSADSSIVVAMSYHL